LLAVVPNDNFGLKAVTQPMPDRFALLEAAVDRKSGFAQDDAK
jgi:hypothetical protein